MVWLRILLLTWLVHPVSLVANLQIGAAEVEITPPSGVPSAGYADRKGEGMEGTHDPLLATALVVDDGQNRLAFCGVDHLGIDSSMMQEIREQARLYPSLEKTQIFVGSSHTHSGPGAYLDIPGLGEFLAGPFSQKERKRTIEGVLQAISFATESLRPGKLGVGYAETEGLSRYRGTYPAKAHPRTTVTVLRAEDLQGQPIALLFNFPMHPTVLKGENRLFSADFVGYTRLALKKQLGSDCVAVYFNGAQGDVLPTPIEGKESFTAAEALGQSLAKGTIAAWQNADVRSNSTFTVLEHPYRLTVQPNSQGMSLPIEYWPSELNLIIWNQTHAFLTLPGELSCVYDQSLRATARALGFHDLSILGLTNDAHGYIILPEAWDQDCTESRLSFGGRMYGEQMRLQAESLLHKASAALLNDSNCWRAFPNFYPSCFGKR